MRTVLIIAILINALPNDASWPADVAHPQVALSAAILAGGRVNPTDAEVTRTLTVDTARRATLIVTCTEDLAVHINLPDGASMIPTGTNGDRYRWYQFKGGSGPNDLPGLGSGFNNLVTMDAPQSGPYTVVLRSRTRLRTPAPFLITLLLDSDLRVGLSVPSHEALKGAPFVIAAVISDDQHPVRGATVLASVTQVPKDPMQPATLSNEVALSDDGRGIDAASGDGIYTGVVTPKATGQFRVAIRVTGRGLGGTAFERNAGLSFRSSDGTIRIRPALPSTRLDEDHDQGVDGLAVPFVLAGPAGMYDVVVSLRAPNGRAMAGHAIVQNTSQSRVVVRFSAEQLKALAVDAPYSIVSVDVFEIMSNDRLLRAHMINAGKTPALIIR